jgi:hypothetical protein
MQLNDLFIIVGAGLSIQLAVNQVAAGNRACVIIPAWYSGGDSFTNHSNVPIIDLRLTGTGLSGPLKYSTVLPNASVVYASNYGVTANTQVALQASWSNASKTITTASGDPAFSSGDVGKVIFGVSNTIQANGYLNGTTMFSGTITAVSSAHVCTISNNTTDASSAPNPSGFTGWVLWGTDDTAALQAAWNASLSATGQTLVLPPGLMMITSAPFINLNGNICNNGIVGAGPNSSGSVLVPAASYNYAGATNALIYYDAGVNVTRLWTVGDSYDQNAFAYTSLRNFTVWGGGQDGTALTTTLPGIFANNAYLENVWLVGWNWNLGNTSNTAPGIKIQGCMLQSCGAWSAGNVGLQVANSGPLTQNQNQVIGGLYGVCSGPGITLLAGSGFGNHLQSFGVQWASVNTSPNTAFGANMSGGNWESFGDQFSGVTCSGGRLHLYGARDNFIGDAGIYVVGGVVYAENSQITKLNISSGSFFDLGGNYQPSSGVSWTSAIGNSFTGGTVFGTGSVTGTAAIATNITPSSGWGTTGAAGNGVSAVTGNTKQIQFTITAAGSPTPSPTIAITFPTPFAVAPICQLKQVGGTNFADVTNPVITSGPSTTTITFTLTGTAIAAHTYVFQLLSNLD